MLVVPAGTSGWTFLGLVCTWQCAASLVSALSLWFLVTSRDGLQDHLILPPSVTQGCVYVSQVPGGA